VSRRNKKIRPEINEIEDRKLLIKTRNLIGILYFTWQIYSPLNHLFMLFRIPYIVKVQIQMCSKEKSAIRGTQRNLVLWVFVLCMYSKILLFVVFLSFFRHYVLFLKLINTNITMLIVI
jgi:hypothetical protein